jgi:uncharacterized membrane protein
MQEAATGEKARAYHANLEDALRRVRSSLLSDRAPHMPSVNAMHDDTLTIGQRIADAVARNMGSWRFIIIQSFILVSWIVLNAIELIAKPWDPYPFILLNLGLSFQAAYAAPFILMSQNRQADKDRLAAEHDYCVNIRADVRIGAILRHLEAQDEVILSILRQLERVHRIEPGEEQRAAEQRLRESQEYEARMLEEVIAREELKAGLKPLEA